MNMTTHHSLLGIDSTSTTEEIKKRYKYLSSRVHPDKGGSNELFKLVKLAYDQSMNGRGHEPIFNNKSSESIEQARLRSTIQRLQSELDLEQNKNKELRVEASHNQDKIRDLEDNIQLLKYRNSALEKQINATQGRSIISNQKTSWIIIIFLCGFIFLTHQSEEKSITLDKVTSTKPEVSLALAKDKNAETVKVTSKQDVNKKQEINDIREYKLLLMSLKNGDNAKALTNDLKRRGYNATTINRSNYFSVVISVQGAKQAQDTINELQRITGSKARIMGKDT
ncbi:DnaJ domain-containing protein [Vibrio rotiferianus]|uniref:DnaJ domain-containing protein n=1 Tax=Vibrio rotiferianus TaxID=190895 RepID=UPI002894DF4F|nr:putative J domain-containing protein [Vibrio rotiferianus]